MQQAHLPLGPDRLLVEGGGLAAGLLHQGGAAVGLPVVLLDLGLQLLELLLDLPALGLGQVQLFPVLPQHLGGALQGLQPDADFQAFFLLVVGDELLRLFRLDPQGLHPVLQLGQDVPQAHQVFLGLVQAALRLLLAVAVAGDARRLLEDLPPVLGLGGHDGVDLRELIRRRLPQHRLGVGPDLFGSRGAGDHGVDGRPRPGDAQARRRGDPGDARAVAARP